MAVVAAADRRGGRAISATEAAKHFGALVDRVRSARAEYVVERGGQPVARIGPIEPGCTVAELLRVLQERPRADEEYLEAVEAGVEFFNRPVVPADPWAR